MMEQIMTDVQKSKPDWNVILLRYFNPVGAHKSGRIGEDPKGIPNNLMPYISQVAVGKLPKLGVFGDDYNTPDGTGVRDYIHVVDLALGHVKAIDYIFTDPGLDVINLGTGTGYSVLDMVKAFQKLVGQRFHRRSNPGEPGILTGATRIRPKQNGCLAGKRSGIWRKCVRTPGDGSLRILTGTADKQTLQSGSIIAA